MKNLVGDGRGGWPELLAEPGAHLHLYGKSEARPGRKMGHVTRLSAPSAYCAGGWAGAGAGGPCIRITSIGMPSRSSCGRTRAASPTTIQTKLSGWI